MRNIARLMFTVCGKYLNFIVTFCLFVGPIRL